jgi:hypothetical protein
LAVEFWRIELRDAFGSAHDVGGAHPLSVESQNVLFHAVLFGQARGRYRSFDVVDHAFARIFLHDGHVLVGGGVKEDLGLFFGQKLL